jgi:hypothetical protein
MKQVVLLAGLLFAFCSPSAPATKTADEILAAYVQALGGETALDRIETREIHARRGHSKVVYYWQKPNKALLVEGNEKIGYDGGSGWMLSAKKRVSRLPKGNEKLLLMDADPVRFVHLKQLYSDLHAGRPETINDRTMEVIVALNERGQTTFYFDAATHLLARIEDRGEVSAYYRHATDFGEYREQDGIKLPFRITHDSDEPGAHTEQIRFSEVAHNVPLRPEIFRRPIGGSVVLGGKR